MLKISKKAEYALMAAKYMALNNHGNAVTAKEISKEYSISFELVAKVLQKLKRNSIVASTQGSKGGYFLLKKPEEITLFEIIKSVEPAYQITNCLKNGFDDDSCSHFNCCKIKDPLVEIQKKIDKIFIDTKLNHIV